jgi:hypothetical protein
MNKVDRILELIHEKSRIRQDEISGLDPNTKDEIIMEILAAEITVLDELYREVEMIKLEKKK